MPRHEFFPSPYRRLHTLTGEEFSVEEGAVVYTGEEPIAAGIVRLEIPPDSSLTITEAKRAIEAAGAFEARVTKARAESVRRREHDLTTGMALPEAVREWIEQKPDLLPLTEQIIAEAMRVEAVLREGGVG